MSLLFWKKNNPQIDAFAQQIANRLFSALPPALFQQALAGEAAMAGSKSGAKKNRGGDIRRVTGEVGEQLRKFAQQNRLGFYGKARLHMQFRSRLIELGYSKDAARSMDELILFQGV